jgi:hypothetical protein
MLFTYELCDNVALNRTKMKNDDLYRLQREIDRLKAELIQTKDDLAKSQAYYREHLPVLIHKSSTNLKKVGEYLSAISIYKKNARLHLKELRDHVDPVTLATIETIDFSLSKMAELIQHANKLTKLEDIVEDAPTIIGTELWDYVFEEFKVDSSKRKINLNGQTITVSNAEFTYFLELIKKPNQEVTFENLSGARTNLSRLKQRIPIFKTLIQSIFNTGSYKLVVTPITAK